MSADARSARDEVLARIARALGRAPDAAEHGDLDLDADQARIERGYRVDDPATTGLGRLERFAARAADYRADVRRVAGPAALAAAVAACVADGAGAYGVPPGLPPAWLAAVDPACLVVDDGLGPHALDALAGTISGCALAVADTGTIVLDGGAGQGRRALSLVPDRLVVVVLASQVVGTVPQAIRALGPGVRAGPRALTLISGPSATSDIELHRVEGVHGPRRLDVLLVADA